MLGSSLLVAPLLEQNRMDRKVYLPKGTWSGLFSHRVYQGNSLIDSEENGKIPVYVKHGSAVPLHIAEKEIEIGTPFDYLQNTNKLHFILAGLSGRSEFVTEDNQVIIVSWNAGQVEVTNPTEMLVSYEII